MQKYCKKVPGLLPYLDRATQLLYSDRQKGIPSFGKDLKCAKANCLEHIIENCRLWIAGFPQSRKNFPAQWIHDMQKEHTEKGFRKKMSQLRRGYPHVAYYFDKKITHDVTYLYAILKKGVTTHRHNTSNIAEISNSLLRCVRCGELGVGLGTGLGEGLGEGLNVVLGQGLVPLHTHLYTSFGRFALEKDPYYVLDFIVTWWGTKIAERQALIESKQLRKALLTPYAAEMYHKSETLARESILSSKAEGTGVHVVTHITRMGPERHRVDLNKRTCDCNWMAMTTVPCPHAIYVADELGLRVGEEKLLHFRNTWFKKYFWAENYVKAYEGLKMTSPEVNYEDTVDLGGERRVTKPLQDKKPRGRKRTNRFKKGSGAKRSRGKWDSKSYVQAMRQSGCRTGPLNPFVQVTDPHFFDKKPQGRKPVPRAVRVAGRMEADQVVYDAIVDEQQNPTTVCCHGILDRVPH